jgi:hypothetical protein
MPRISRMRARWALAGLVVAAAGSLTSIADAAAPADQAAQAQALVRQVLPSSSATMDPAQAIPSGQLSEGLGGGDGFSLDVTLSPSDLKLPGDARPLAASRQAVGTGDEPDGLAAAEAGWKLQLATAVAAERDPDLVRYSATPAGVGLAPGAQSYLVGSLRAGAGQPLETVPHPDLGTVAPAHAVDQLRMNLATLEGVLPPQAITAADIDTVVVDKVSVAYGLELRIHVSDLHKLAPYYGDLLAGPATGLNGSERAKVDGLSVVVEDDAGSFLAGWSSERVMTGTVMWSQDLNVPDAIAPTGRYVNELGGPPTAGIGFGGTGR